MNIFKELRENLRMSPKELADELGISQSVVNRLERGYKPSSNILTRYIDDLDLGEKYDRQLRILRKNNWRYDEDSSAIKNELRRIRNGLGKSSEQISVEIGKYKAYWARLENDDCSQIKYIGLTDDDLDNLDILYNISSTTLKRHNIAVELTEQMEPMPEVYKRTNPEIQEPLDLYDDYYGTVQPETYMELIEDIEDDVGSILSISQLDPRLIELRRSLGVIYYDELEEIERVFGNR